ncbi:hypothetical protein EPR50_G00010320 [Perca flavescens]|uniref:Uncharacterized protein n=1 Tax=Perca flavescens TaxID=8167 RepID=A0A484DMB3_PERFV|nr:hypothetical protein EPR50_G00010320 [Perca flavescens]
MSATHLSRLLTGQMRRKPFLPKPKWMPVVLKKLKTGLFQYQSHHDTSHITNKSFSQTSRMSFCVHKRVGTE